MADTDTIGQKPIPSADIVKILKSVKGKDFSRGHALFMFSLVFISLLTCFRAPTDCFQYLTGISGSISSLNYPTTALVLTYTICVRREYGYCGIEWSESAITSPDPFDLNTGAAAIALVGGAVASASNVYLSIPGNQ